MRQLQYLEMLLSCSLRAVSILSFVPTPSLPADRYPFSGMAAAICVPYLSFEVIMAESKRKKWVQSVKTDSTHPPAGLFTRDAATIARVLASKKVSPKGPQSAMRMLNYFINRAGRGLSASRRAELQRAKRLLSKRIAARRAKP